MEILKSLFRRETTGSPDREPFSADKVYLVIFADPAPADNWSQSDWCRRLARRYYEEGWKTMAEFTAQLRKEMGDKFDTGS